MSKFFETESDISNEERLVICEAIEHSSSTTKLLVALSEYLNHGGNDEVGSELVSDFAKMFADHEEQLLKEDVVENKFLN